MKSQQDDQDGLFENIDEELIDGRSSTPSKTGWTRVDRRVTSA